MDSVEKVVAVIFLIIGLFIAVVGALSYGEMEKKNLMAEAYKRGLAVECLGKVGYYWECE